MAHAVPHGHTADAQEARGLRLVSPGLAQGFDERGFFFEGLLRLGCRKAGRFRFMAEDLGGQLIGFNGSLFGNDKGIFQSALQFPHVSRPRIAHEQLHGFGTQPADMLFPLDA